MIIYVLLILLITIIIQNIIDYRECNKKLKNDNKISIIVPFIKRDHKFLNKCLNEQRKQTLIAYEIIIAGQIPSDEEINKILYKYSDLNIIFIDTTNKTYAGVNRNIGAIKSTGDIYLFTDVDDIYHYQRNEIIQYTFDRFNPLFVGHQYQKNDNNFRNIKIDNLKYKYMDEAYDYTFNETRKAPFSIRSSSGLIHNGHIAVHKDVFKKFGHRYLDLEKGQDSDFNSRLLRKLFYLNYSKESFIIVTEDLSYYIPNDYQI